MSMGGFPDITTELGIYVENFVNYVATTFEKFFNVIFFIASKTINAIDDFLVWLPWWVFILIIVLLGWYFRSLLAGLTFGFFIFLLVTFVLCEDMMTTIAIIVIFVAIMFIIEISIC